VHTAEISTKFNEPQSEDIDTKGGKPEPDDIWDKDCWDDPVLPDPDEIAVRHRRPRKGEYDWAAVCMNSFAGDYDGRKRECFERIVNAPEGKNPKAAKKDKVESKTKTGKSTNTVRGIRWIATQIQVRQTPPMLARAAVLDAYGFSKPAAYFKWAQTEMRAAARRTHSTTSTPPEKKRKTPHFPRTDSVSSSSSSDDPTTGPIGKRDYERGATEIPRKKRRRRKKDEYVYLPISRCL